MLALHGASGVRLTKEQEQSEILDLPSNQEARKKRRQSIRDEFHSDGVVYPPESGALNASFEWRAHGR